MTATSKTSEIVFNGYLAEILRSKHPLWRKCLHVEQTGVFRDHPRLRPDILILPPSAQPVVVETEYAPGSSVENDAKTRLGLAPLGSEHPVEQAIAVRIPDSLRHDQSHFIKHISDSDFDYCLFSGNPSAPQRWPDKGWLNGSVDDIVRCIEHAMVSQRLVDEGLLILEDGVRVAANAIRDAVVLGFVDTERNLGRILNQHGGEQTNRMAMTIIANALTFHSTISGFHDIPTVTQIQNDTDGSFRMAVLAAWDKVLRDINYWPIFKVASDLLASIRAQTANRILDILASASERLADLGVATRHDLSGRMFQNLIVDRKFLATFYTLPASATLLAEMAAGCLDADWSRLEEYYDLTLADFSCGTGTLLSAGYHAVLARYRHAGGDDSEIHKRMIERSVIAADIMPAAAHLCASQLSSVHPTILFDNTRVYTMPYGTGNTDEQYRDVSIGSLDLIESGKSRSLFATGEVRASGARGDTEVADIEVPHESVDLVIMNPPFTRPTNHESTDVPVPSFAGFRTTGDEQQLMSGRLSDIRRGLKHPAGHGNAGLASNFVDLAHVKVKPGGVIALVLPITAIQGASWEPTRNLLASAYRNITVVTIAGTGGQERAFSADTGMAETLVIATRKTGAASPDLNQDILFVNLHWRLCSMLEAAETARIIGDLPASSGAGYIRAGEQTLGSYIRAPLGEGGCTGLRESALAGVMIALRRGELRVPQHPDRQAVPIIPLGQLGKRGLLDRDIGNRKDDQPPYRGPFRIHSVEGIPSYPVLWGHDAERERHLLVEPDSMGVVRPGCDERALTAWQTASRLHFTRDFQLNSQSLAACLTPGPALGGRAWPNFCLHEGKWDELIVLWANCSLGLMAFWWEGSRQQQGRAILTISKLPDLLVLDPRGFPEHKLTLAGEILRQFESRSFLPANEAYRDETRKALDTAVLIDLLELPEDMLEPLDTLRRQWSSEPSVHGGKRTSP
ncbi:MAG: hypothetical protein OXF73_01075 [Gammaproteobacteria bacterium]|nr:hypothetical protein [Gammaproteobacteria bacterium]